MTDTSTTADPNATADTSRTEMKVKVRFALINYTAVDTVSRRPYQAIGFRGQIVTIIDPNEGRRLAELGAIVPEDAELERPGTLVALPESPSEEEVLAWVMAASPSEIRGLAADRPNLAEKIAGAAMRAEENHRRAMDLLGQAQDVALSVTPDTHRVMGGTVGPDAIATGVTSDSLTGTTDTAPGQQTADGGTQPGGTGSTSDDATSAPSGGTGSTQPPAGGPSMPNPADVVKGNASEVVDFISNNPGMAAQILAAENAHTDGKPRTSVVRAVEAAAGHTQ